MPLKNLFSTDNAQSDAMQSDAEGYDPEMDPNTISDNPEQEEVPHQEADEEPSPELQTIAELLHDRICKKDHVEVCSYYWHHYVWTPSQMDDVHKEYLAKAEKILALCHGNFEFAKSIVEAL